MSWEIERKFLIALPEEASLCRRCSAVYEIEQTYLRAPDHVTARVRRRVGQREEFFYTEKEFCTNRTCVEREESIDKAAYTRLLERRDETMQTIVKRRYCLPWEGFLFEIDVYPFWQQVAVMEVELASEDQSFSFPEGITVLREITDERRMKNAALAREIPEESSLL